jgi:hypothetical protein
VDREEEHAQFGMTVYMSKRLDTDNTLGNDHSSSGTSP